MATKYIDHGAYGATGSFTASTSGSSTTLTLGTPGSFTGVIKPGMFLTGTGISAETYISSVTYNSSDQVTAVTMSAARTISSTTITATGAGSPESVPVWGSAQDGDGTASTAGTPSTASIVFTGAPSTGSIAVCGVTLSPTWGASATTAADALAAAINASTTTITGPATFTTFSQLRNHIYARGPSTGAAAGTCELMTRQAAAHTGTAITHTLNNVSSGGTISFSGGTGGCWGYLFNPIVTAWKSGVAVGGYGVWAAAVPYCGSMSAGDVVKVRSGKTITLATNTSVTWTMAAMGSAGSPVRFDIDDSSVWSDGSDPVLKIAEAHTGNTLKTWGHLVTTFAHINAKQYSGGQRNLVIESTGNGPTIPVTAINYGGPVRFDNLDIYCPGTPTATPGPQASCMAQFLAASVTATAGVSSVFKNCRIVQPGQAPSANTYGLIYQGVNVASRADFINCEFSLTAPSAAWVHTLSPNSGGQSICVQLDSCVFTGFVSGSRLVSTSVPSPSLGQVLFAKNCSYGGITVFGPTYLGLGSGVLDVGLMGFYSSSQYGNREFVVDRAGKMYVEWVQAKGRPTLSAKLHDGVTPWSIYATTTASSSNIGRHSPAELPRIGKAIPASYLLAEAARTFRLNFLLESNLSWTKQDISLLIDYVGTDDIPRTFDTYDAAAGALSTDATSEWSATSWNGQTWNPKYFSVTTPVSVKAGTEVGIYVRIHTTCSADTRGVIIDPEVVIT